MEKTFDCLKMKEEVQARVYERTKDMIFAELRAYLDQSLAHDVLWQRLVNHNTAQKENRRNLS